MISGRQALGSIDDTLRKAQAEVDGVDEQIRQTSEQVVAGQRAQLEDLRALAAERLARLDDVPVSRDLLDHVEQQARKLLGRRDDALAALLGEIDDKDGERERSESERMAEAARLDEAVAAVDGAERVVQDRLDADPDYRAARDAAESAQRQSMHAAEKAQRSADELAEKGRAYRDDPLFMYLWERHYGLPEYSAGGLARWLDGKVARLIGFADARANFSRLNEIPLRLEEHARHLAAAAEAAWAALKALDERARAADGIPALEAVVEQAQQRLDAIDARIATLEDDHQALLARRAAFAAGEDEFTRQAVDYLATEFGRAEIADLRRVAMATPYPEDDVIVSRMRQREDEQRVLRETLQDLRGLLQKQQQRLHELEKLRAEFKRQRYDRAGSVFTNEAMLPVLLGQFLAGMVDRGMLWKVLREHQRYRPHRSNPDFGSGGFGRGTVWHGGLGDLGDVIGGLGRGGFGGGLGGGLGGGGLGGGGGFRTGGGF